MTGTETLYFLIGILLIGGVWEMMFREEDV